MKILIKLSPTILFVIGLFGIQLFKTNIAFLIFGILVVIYVFGISVFAERYRKSAEMNFTISINSLFLFVVVFGMMAFSFIRIMMEVLS